MDLGNFWGETGLLTNLAAAAFLVVGFFAKRFLQTKTAQTIAESFAGDVFEVVKAGANATYQTLYKELTAKLADDGKLSKEEIRQLHLRARAEAMSATQDPKVREAIRNMTGNAWDLILKQAVNELKSEGGLAKTLR